MKKFLLALTVVFSAFSAIAENSLTTIPADTSKAAPQVEKPKGPSTATFEMRKKMDKMFAKYSRDHITVDLLGTNWNYNPSGPGFGSGANTAGLRTKWFSRGVQIGFNWDFRIKGSRVSIAPGISYSCSNIYSRSTMSRTDSAGTSFTAIRTYGTDTTAKINKLVLQYLNIPIEIRIRSNIDKYGNCFKWAFGIVGGIRVDAHTKFKIKQGNDTNVYIVRRDPDFNLFRVAPMFRFGYSFFNVTASYDVISVFQANKGPKANAFAVGISFTAL